MVEILAPRAPSSLTRVDEIRHWVDALPIVSADWRQPPVADARRFAANQRLSVAARSAVRGSDAPGDLRARLVIAAAPNCLQPTETPEQRRGRADLQPAPLLGPTPTP